MYYRTIVRLECTVFVNHNFCNIYTFAWTHCHTIIFLPYKFYYFFSTAKQMTFYIFVINRSLWIFFFKFMWYFKLINFLYVLSNYHNNFVSTLLHLITVGREFKSFNVKVCTFHFWKKTENKVVHYLPFLPNKILHTQTMDYTDYTDYNKFFIQIAATTLITQSWPVLSKVFLKSRN